MAHVMNAPKKFEGTDAEKAANRATHYFIDGRCMDCDCRPWGRIAEYPCGADVPRVVEEANNYMTIGAAAYDVAGGF